MNAINQEIYKHVEDLLIHAENEEKSNNWNGSIELLRKAEELVLDKDLKEIEGRIYYRLGRNCHLAGDSAKAKESILKNYQMAIESYQKAKEIYEKLKIEEKVNALSGFIDVMTYLFGFGVGKELKLLESAKEFFKHAKLIYQQQGNFENSVKMEIMETRAFSLLIGELTARFDEKTDYKKIIPEFDELVIDIIEKLRKKPKLSDFYLHRFLVCMGYCFHWIGTYISAGFLNTKKQLYDYLKRHEEIIKIIESNSDYETYYEGRFYAYTICASFSLIMGAYYAETLFAIKDLYKNAGKWHKKAESLLPKVKFNTSLSTFHMLRFSIAIAMILLGYSSTDFKHTVQILTDTINQMSLFYPKPMVGHMIVASNVGFVIGSLDETKTEMARLEFAKNIMSIMEFGQKEVPTYNDSNYKLHNFLKSVEWCTGYAVFGDLTADKTEKARYLEKTHELFDEIIEFSKLRIVNNQAFFLFCHCASRISVMLAKNTEEIAEKKNYYQMAIELIERAIKMPFDFHRYDNLFFLGKIYYEFGKLLDDEHILKKSYLAYVNAIDFCKNRGFYSLVGSGYVYLAQLEDRLGNFISASENYQKAIESFDQALLILTFMNLGKVIENTKNYLNAWKLIEIAKSYHAKEDHQNARSFYQQASDILQKLRDYRFESAFYIAWSELESAEELSKKNNHQDAAASYQKATTLFQEAIEILNKSLKKASSPEDKLRISNLIEGAKLRNAYCTARHLIETAKLESLQGNHTSAAEIYNNASRMFENLCEVYRIKKEKDELRAVYYLCKAWENLERGEVTQDASLHAAASDLFLKASNLTSENKIKKLSIGNSLYCSALEAGIIFDKSLNLADKMQNYKKIKMSLREAAKNYQMGGFEQDAKWALATSTFFDGVWQLIQSDNEVNVANKNQYLNLAVNYLNSALIIFEEVGAPQKKDNILKYLDMIKAEKAILASALDVIGKPTISGSSIGINAPACPVEISSSLNLDEMQKQDMAAESERNWQKRIFHLYLYKPEAGVLIYDYPFQADQIADKTCPAGLASASLAGISMIIQEVTKKETKLKVLEQEDVTILLEYGKYLSGALIVEENLMTLRKKLKELIDVVENFYQKDLETFGGKVDGFTKVGQFIEQVFQTA